MLVGYSHKLCATIALACCTGKNSLSIQGVGAGLVFVYLTPGTSLLKEF